MSTKQIGDSGEDAAVDYLTKSDFKIICRNWRTRWCEIDIVAQKNKCVYFVEVKFRSSDAWGSGLEYITPKKLKQMKFAAEFWIADNGWTGEAVLAAAAVDADGAVEFIENITG